MNSVHAFINPVQLWDPMVLLLRLLCPWFQAECWVVAIFLLQGSYGPRNQSCFSCIYCCGRWVPLPLHHQENSCPNFTSYLIIPLTQPTGSSSSFSIIHRLQADPRLQVAMEEIFFYPSRCLWLSEVVA